MENGIRTMTLNATEGHLVDQERSANLFNPVLVFFKDGQVTSRMRSPYGRVQMQTKEIEAWGGVQVVSADSATLTTARLRYDPKTQLLLSDDDVKIERNGSVTVGHGMEATTDLNRMTLKKQTARVKTAI